MAITWTEDLATGVDLIDEQHKELFSRINDLLEACRAGKGRENTGKLISFLEDYVISHFGTEEKHMQKYDYPDYKSHKAQHLKFMETLDSFKREVDEKGVGVHLVIGINRTVVEWLNNHIRKVDRAMGGYLKTKMEN